MRKVGRPPTAKSLKEYFASGSGRKLWKEGKDQFEEGGGGLPEYDDGKYRAKVVRAGTEQSQSSSRWQNVIEFKFLEGEYKGKTVRQYQGVDNPTGIAILLQTFTKLGFEIEDPDDIEGVDKKLSKKQPTVDIRLRTKGEYQNVLVLGSADEDADEEEAEDEEEEEDDADVDEDEDDEEESSDDDDDEDEDDDEEEEEDEDDEDEEDEKKSSKKKSKKSSKKKAADDEDEEEEADEEDEDEEDDDDEDEEESEDDDDEDEAEEEEQVALEVGMKLKVKYDGDEVVGKIVKVNEKKKNVKVKLKNGDKVVVKVPDDIVDVVE